MLTNIETVLPLRNRKYALTLENKREKKRNLVEEDYLALKTVPMVLFHPDRMIIMKALFYHGNVEYRQLRHNIPKITDGSLASHLKVLERLDFIKVYKEIIGRKLRTSYEITEYGREIFRKFEDSLKAFIKSGGSFYE